MLYSSCTVLIPTSDIKAFRFPHIPVGVCSGVSTSRSAFVPVSPYPRRRLLFAVSSTAIPVGVELYLTAVMISLMTISVDHLFMHLRLLWRNSYLSPLAIFLVGLSLFLSSSYILSMKPLSPMIFKYFLPFCRWSFCFLDLSPSTHKSFYFY